MRLALKSSSLALILFASLMFLADRAPAQVSPEPSIVSDQKPGSILFFNKYTSNPSSPATTDTQINITNTNPNLGISLHLFFIDGVTCSIADGFIDLTQNQTASFLASDFDPGVEGYIVAVAVGGSPTQFNFLVGDEYIRENNFLARLPAVTISRVAAGDVPFDANGNAMLIFDGVEYDRLPASVAVSSINSPVTDATVLAVYSPTSNLVSGGSNSVTIFTLVYDDLEHTFSTSFRVSCFSEFSLANLRVVGGSMANIVPLGHTGWMRLTAANRPLLGSALNRGPIFNGGVNFRHLTLLHTYTILVPAF